MSSQSLIREINSRYDLESAANVDIGLSVVYFDASWHATRVELVPKLQGLCENYQARFYSVLVDELSLEQLAADAGVKTLPTFLLFKQGKIASTVEGPNVVKLEKLINKAGC